MQGVNEDIVLTFPYYKRNFELATGTSMFTIVKVLQQSDVGGILESLLLLSGIEKTRTEL